MHEDRERLVVFSGGGTGGHLYPALALADALRELRADVRALFVGAARGIEARVLPDLDEEHVLLPVRGLPRGAPLWRQAASLVPLGRSLFEVLSLFRGRRPEVVVVTGGYAGGPAGLAAVILGIPLVLQEQNARPGVVTRVLSRWAKRVHLAFPEAREQLPAVARDAVRISGNPVRAAEPGSSAGRAAREALGLDQAGRVVLVVGGSQGSVALNRAVVEAVRSVATGALERPADLQLLWSTGPAHLDDVRATLGEAGGPPSWVHAVGFLDRMPRALAAVELAVSRAGAMATSEFLAAGLPSILVPLPTAAAGHQERNAEALEGAGAAVHLPEAGLTGPRLWSKILEIIEDEERLRAMARAAQGRGRPGAAREIAADIASLLGRAA